MKFGTTVRENFIPILNEVEITQVKSMKILGFVFDSNCLKDDDNLLTRHISKVRKSIYSLHSFGIRNNGLTPALQAFIIKTYCLSKGLYAIENMTIKNVTLDKLTTMENLYFKQILGLNKYSKITEIRKILKLKSFKHVFIKQKFNFIDRIEKTL